MDYCQFIRNPLIAIENIISKDERGYEQLTEIVDKLISNISTADYNKIPLISGIFCNNVSNGSLVRYRGMVQDQFDTEFYLKRYTVINTETNQQNYQSGIYQDITDLPSGYEIDYDNTNNITGDRQTLYIVPIPGETEWVIKERVLTDTPSGCRTKDGTRRHFAKRTLQDDDDDEEMDISIDNNYVSSLKRTKNSSTDNITSSTSSNNLLKLNNPLPGEKRLPCLVKVYNNSNYTINTLYEFTGIVSSYPELVIHSNDDLINPLESESVLTCSSPPSLIPRLHCIKATPLYHCHPNLPLSLSAPISNEVLQQIGCDWKTSRQNLLDMLTTILMGDQLTAEFVLLHLISSVFGRTAVLAIGKLSINISQCPVNLSLPKKIYNLINQLVTKSHFLPLTLSNLNSSKFIPNKNYDTNRLETGILQLSSGTHLIVDETVMKPGQLDKEGVANIAALGGVVQSQRVKYDLKYYQQEFDCDLPVIIISEGKSLIKVDCHVPLRVATPPDPLEQISDPLSEYTDDIICQIRQYLVLCKLLKYNVSDTLQKSLQDDFVERRRVDNEMTGEIFHYILNLSRLITISHRQEELTIEYWQHAKKIYLLQKQRLVN